jgi:hypothetical protein
MAAASQSNAILFTDVFQVTAYDKGPSLSLSSSSSLELTFPSLVADGKKFDRGTLRF